jgi:transposase
MESTGVCWIPIYEMLEAAGIRVYLVNARHFKTVPGRKSDYNGRPLVAKASCPWPVGRLLQTGR